MHPSPDRSPREDVLTARAASAWLAERGTTGDGPSHLIADEVAVPGFRVARVWHTASTLVRAATPGVRFAVVVADGDADATQGGATRRLGSGDLLVAADSGPLTLRIDDRIARFEFEVRTAGTGVSPAVTEVLDAGAVVADAAPSFRPVLLAAVNAAFNAGLDSDAAGFASFRLATTSLLTGLLEEAFAPRLEGRSRRESVLSPARSTPWRCMRPTPSSRRQRWRARSRCRIGICAGSSTAAGPRPLRSSATPASLEHGLSSSPPRLRQRETSRGWRVSGLLER
uniref:hypothetical protein n=1 Tax=Rathayibacter sp. VKM Ac-2630 TaxID=1938617 RepID=UPI001F34C702|nr:hypothetical protein [Rathayibacter sp. VKM Ac-2630]